MPKGVYLRVGSSSRKASEEHIEELMRENKRTTYDEETIQAPIEILSSDLISKIYPKAATNKLLSEKIIIQSATNPNKYYPTIAGVLWFFEQPDKYIPEAHVRCTRFKRTQGRDIIQSDEIGGSLRDQIEDTFNLVTSWLQRDFSLKGAKLKGKMLLPEEALREAIINAVVHRKYSIPGVVKIALFEDRLEIFSPGILPGHIDLNNLGDGTTYLRNPIIAKIARRYGYMEKLGTGINLILESCRLAGLRAPEFIEGADSVKVIFHFSPDVAGKNVDDENLLKLFLMRDEVSISDVVRYFSVSRNTATRKLNKLVLSGKLKRIGKGPAVRYLLQ